jgi:hypothetical protein
MSGKLLRDDCEQSGSATDRILQAKAKLIRGVEADASARKLGDLAIDTNDEQALLALWEAITETSHLRTIIDPCGWTIGRICRETQNPRLVDICFDIFAKSAETHREPVVDKISYTVGEVALRARNDNAKQRAKEFVRHHANSDDPLVRRCYAYTARRIAQ